MRLFSFVFVPFCGETKTEISTKQSHPGALLFLSFPPSSSLKTNTRIKLTPSSFPFPDSESRKGWKEEEEGFIDFFTPSFHPYFSSAAVKHFCCLFSSPPSTLLFPIFHPFDAGYSRLPSRPSPQAVRSLIQEKERGFGWEYNSRKHILLPC